MRKKILAVVGQTCSGKDTLIEWVYRSAPVGLVSKTRRFTTRPPRIEEAHGNSSYRFVTPRELADFEYNDDVVEESTFRGWKYGTLDSDLKMNSINMLSIDLKSLKRMVRSLTQSKYDIRCVLIDAPLKSRMKRYRDREHGTPGVEMYRRMASDAIMYRHPVDDLLDLGIAYAYLPDEFGLYRKTTSVVNFCKDWVRADLVSWSDSTI